MKTPYVDLPDRQFWKRAPGIDDGSRLNPVTPPPFKISRQDRIVTAGSCFAQHVGRYMSEAGFNHYITESAHPVIPPDLARKHNYGMFSARYGNVYTARQLRQLLERAYGRFAPIAKGWKAPNSPGVVDPFRPQIQPSGFLSEAELEADRNQHFRCIRKAIEEMEVFVFTLGLTEAWADTRDGAIFPIAPGVAGGAYDPTLVRFVNFDEQDTYNDLKLALDFIRAKNPDVKVILTVSPVPLNATYENRHVLVSTTWSKAVLRIVAEKASRTFQNCLYFPSYEIITSPHVRGRYFAEDCREVTQEGVNHVMQLFLHHFADVTHPAGSSPVMQAASTAVLDHLREMQEKIDVLCDEAAIDNA